MILSNKTKQSEILGAMTEAKSFFPRLKGLLGQKGLSDSEGLWIHQCNSIHTIGMKFAIDCIFLDQSLKVKKIVTEIRPGRLILPIWGASSVVEVRAGLCQVKKIEVGDELNVGD